MKSKSPLRKQVGLPSEIASALSSESSAVVFAAKQSFRGFRNNGKLDRSREVLESYWAASLAQEIRDIRQTGVESAEALLAKVKASVEAGSGMQSQQQQAEISSLQAQRLEVEAQESFESAYDETLFLLGAKADDELPLPNEVSLKAISKERPESKPDESGSFALARRMTPRIQALAHELNRKKLEQEWAHRGTRPDPSENGFNRGKSDRFPDPTSISLAMSGGENPLERIDSDLSRAEQELESAEAQLRKDVRAACRLVSSGLDALAHAQKASDLAELILGRFPEPCPRAVLRRSVRFHLREQNVMKLP